MKYQWICITASCVLIGIGLVAAFIRGGGIYDIDLRGGSSVQVTLREPLGDAELRSLVKQAFHNKEYKGSSVDATVKPVKKADNMGRRNTYRVDSIYPETEKVQEWLTTTLVDSEGKSLLKYYHVEYDPLSGLGEKQGALRHGDESTFFTTLNQSEGEPKTDSPKNAPALSIQTALNLKKFASHLTSPIK